MLKVVFAMQSVKSWANIIVSDVLRAIAAVSIEFEKEAMDKKSICISLMKFSTPLTMKIFHLLLRKRKKSRSDLGSNDAT